MNRRVMGTLFPLFCFFLLSESNAQTFTDASHLLDPVSGDALGASAIDFNNDGLIDIYHPGRLYLNKGAGGFKDIVREIHLIEGDGVFGAVFGDYDNDGYLDVFFEDFRVPGRLYRNRATSRFENVNQAANFYPKPLAQGAGWVDFNLDGTLDLFVNNDAGENQLFKNLGDGTFLDISLSAGVEELGNSYGMAWGDYNNDRFPDIFIATCSGTPARSIKHLFRNNGNETFTNVNAQAGVNDSFRSWGVVWLDYDNDGYLDIYVANIGGADLPPARQRANILYKNNRDGTFTDVSFAVGVAGTPEEIGYANAAADFDNDGWTDIYLANSNSNPHKLFHNNGDGTFTDIAPQAGIHELHHAAVAVADFNNDGWMDIFTPGAFGSPNSRLWLSNGGSNHWLRVSLRGVTNNYYGIGARIEIYAGGNKQIRELNAGDSFCSQNMNMAAHFGTGAHVTVDSLIIRWPRGQIDRLFDVTVDRQITVVEGLDINNPPTSFGLTAPADSSLLGAPDTPVQFTWQAATDAENDALSYRIRLSGPEIDTLFLAISENSFSIESEVFRQNLICSWTVDVMDFHSVTASHDVFHFADAECRAAGAFAVADIPLEVNVGSPRGLSWVDINNDDKLDIFITGSGGSNSLLRNNGDLTFTPLSGQAIVDNVTASQGHTWGDFDNDGYIDVFITTVNQRNLLYRNDSQSFAQIDTGSIVTDVASSVGATWVDLDNDGNLDLSVANRIQTDFLYQNLGNGTFLRITEGAIVMENARSTMLLWADIDNDRDADAFVVSNDRNSLYVNHGNLTFQKSNSGPLTDTDVGTQGASWGDYDNDGDSDLLVVTSTANPNFLFRNDGAGSFEAVQLPGLTTEVGNTVASGWADFDNDGDLDVFIAAAGLSFIYRNDGNGSFTRLEREVTVYAGALGAAWGDYDRDGDLDLLTAISDPVLYENTGNGNHWLSVRCQGITSNRSAIGAKVRVRANINDTPVWQMREISSQSGRFAQSSLRAHFGLGDATVVDSLIVEWPSGQTDISEDISVDQFLDAIEGQIVSSVSTPIPRTPVDFALHQNYPNPFNPTTQIRYSLAHGANVSLSIYNVAGQKIRSLLLNEQKEAGEHLVQWDGLDDLGLRVASGVYIYLLEEGSSQKAKARKMLLLK